MNIADKISRKLEFGVRRGKYFEVKDLLTTTQVTVDSFPQESKIGKDLRLQDEIQNFEKLDLIYRTLCAVLYNFAPTSGHPGGSISSGRFVEAIIYETARYDLSDPDCETADAVIYAAGHKALGLYAMWALRNEIARAYKPQILPDDKHQLRLEDLLGFRKNPANNLPLFTKFKSKALDGHPTPATPFVKLATGASGVGDPAAFGYALGLLDYFGENAPKVHVIEGEGGMTPGRVAEALAAASAVRLHNVILHVDFNQASIDSNNVCREGNKKGDYVQWNPAELCYLNDFNVIYVDDGKNFNKIFAAQKMALELDNKMPTAIVYRTVKGWKYGMEGRASHGAGHKFCSEDYYKTIAEFENGFGTKFPRFDFPLKPENVEKNFYDTLMVIRDVIETNRSLGYFGELLEKSKNRLVQGVPASDNLEAREEFLEKSENRLVQGGLPPCPETPAKDLRLLYDDKTFSEYTIPEPLVKKPGTVTTLRAALGDALGYINKVTNGALMGAAADLLSSTSVNLLNDDFPGGYYDSVDNPKARLLPIGGICEDAIGAFMAGLSSFGKHIGVSSSYGAFIAPLEHIAARLHGIGQQNKVMHFGGNYNTWIMVNAHAGLKTGEDGPTHADPQCLQLLTENFPPGVLITLTPWEPGEIWHLLMAGLKKRPAVLAPFVTRPNEVVIDRELYRLAPAVDSIKGVYLLRTGVSARGLAPLSNEQTSARGLAPLSEALAPLSNEQTSARGLAPLSEALAPLSNEQTSARGLAPLSEALAPLSENETDGTIILQESGVTIEFITKVLPRLDKEGINLNLYYISSAELFDMLPDEEKQSILPGKICEAALGITGFTLPTMYRWITSPEMRKRILHPFRKGYYLGSGSAESVLLQAGLDGDSMYKEVKAYLDSRVRRFSAAVK
jgi:transketolase